MQLEKINIAIAGHTNTGKTTLIRTLMRSPIGEIADRANVTKGGEPYDYDDLQATFTDTPGFQKASDVLRYWDVKKAHPNSELLEEWEDDISLDMEVIKSLENSHVAIYVGSLSVVPDDSHKKEISVVKKIQPRVLAILNQEGKQRKASSEEIVQERIRQWKEMFQNEGIESIVVFDAYWDKPAKINEIYESVRKTLAPEYRDLFDKGLNQFKKRQAEIRQEACDLLASCIKRCQKQSTVSVKEVKYLEKKAKEEIAYEVLAANSIFLQRVTVLYKTAAEHPTESKDDLDIRLKNSPDFVARFKYCAVTSSVTVSVAAAFGAAIGGGISGWLSGGFAIVTGATLGAQIGASIGGVIGSLSLFSDSEDSVNIGLSSKEIRTIAAQNLASIWGLSNVGYGRHTNLEEEEIESVKNKILKSGLLPPNSDWPNIDWTKVVEQYVINACQKALDRLESE